MALAYHSNAYQLSGDPSERSQGYPTRSVIISTGDLKIFLISVTYNPSDELKL